MSNLLLSVCLFLLFLVAVAPAFLGGISERSIPYHILFGPVVYLSGMGAMVPLFFSRSASMLSEPDHTICWAGWAAALSGIGRRRGLLVRALV